MAIPTEEIVIFETKCMNCDCLLGDRERAPIALYCGHVWCRGCFHDLWDDACCLWKCSCGETTGEDYIFSKKFTMAITKIRNLEDALRKASRRGNQVEDREVKRDEFKCTSCNKISPEEFSIQCESCDNDGGLCIDCGCKYHFLAGHQIVEYHSTILMDRYLLKEADLNAEKIDVSEKFGKLKETTRRMKENLKEGEKQIEEIVELMKNSKKSTDQDSMFRIVKESYRKRSVHLAKFDELLESETKRHKESMEELVREARDQLRDDQD